MTRPVMLDLFCKAGGASMGYHRAGFEVVGVDIEPQPRYPFRFIQADVIALDLPEVAARLGAVAIAGSPPCKVNTSLKAFSAAHHKDLIPEFREQCLATGLPYVIENVPGASLIDPTIYCGSSFPELGVRRHRLFESSVPLVAPPCDHDSQAARSPQYPVKRYHSGEPVIVMSPVIGVYGRGQGLGPGEIDLWKKAMGIDWMIRDELAQSIPPAYTEHIGRQLMAALMREAS